MRPRISPLLTNVCFVSAAFFILSTAAGWAAADSGRGLSYFGTTERIRGFDPIEAGDTTSAAAVSKLYEGLLEYEYLARPYTVRPLLAAKMPEISEDGLTYTFPIKKGVRFHDNPCFPGGKGRELVAEDFVYSWKRLADSNNKPKGYWVFEGRIVGLDEFHKKSGEGPIDYSIEVEGIKALDSHTLQIKLTEPYPQLMWILTMDYTFAVPREAVEYYGDEFLNNPVGTGPFLIKSWKRNYRIEYVRNPHYHGDRYPSHGEPGDKEAGLLEDAGKPLPLLDRVVEYVVADESTDWLMFLSGQLAASGISRSNFDAVINQQRDLNETLSARGIRLYKTPRMFTTYLGFNMTDPVVGMSDDPAANERRKKLRQALSCAVDMNKWVEFYNNRMIPASGPIPPGVAGYDPNKPLPYAFDLERARKLLAEAGYPEGRDPATGKRLTITMEIGSAADPESRQSVDLLASFFNKLGIEFKPSYNNWPEFLKKLERKQVQMYQLGWIIDYPDAENFLQLFYSKNASPGPNHSNYSNPEFDKLYDKIRTMQDTPERTAIYQQMSDIVIEDAPWIFLTHPLSFGLFQPWFLNFKPHDFPYPNAKFYKVDPARMRN
jgi:oligopeptide transport system substrate-binding protein